MSGDDLDLFCAIHGVAAGKLRNPGSVFRPYEIIRDHAVDYAGYLDCIRIDKGVSRLGNRVYQMIHASLVARRLRVRNLVIEPLFDFAELPLQDLELRVVALGTDLKGHCLQGEFFHYLGFESLLEPLDPSFLRETVDKLVAPLFVPPETGVLNSHIMVLHFRSGDIFANVGTDGFIPSLYVMPPASFYTAAFDYARLHFGINEARIVYEDRGNPAIEVVETYLSSAGVPFVSQSKSLIEDWSTLLSAQHLAVPFGTFGEAAALLSKNLQTLFSFRHIESHEFIYNRPRSLVSSLLAGARNVKLIVARDSDAGYIPERGWNGSPEQMDLIRRYPADRVELTQQPCAVIFS